MISSALTIIGLALLLTLIGRGWHGEFLSRFPVFYSYIAYVLVGALVTLTVSWLRPEYHANLYWLRYMLTLVVEFAVLVEISDHIFHPYPAIRRLGRFITFCICFVFFLLYVLPSLGAPQPSSIAILDFVKRTSLTKAAIILSLLGGARYFRLPLGRNISGIAAGFSIYLAVNVANFTLAERLGRSQYGEMFSTVLRSAFDFTLLTWTIALWRYEPFPAGDRDVREGKEEAAVPLGYQLGRFNTVLSRLLGK